MRKGIGMKKIAFLSLILALSVAFCGCAGWFGHEKYTEVEDYSKIFDLSEIRYREALELFPKEIDSLDVRNFYFEWELGLVGSADVQFLLSVTYEDAPLQEESARIQSLANGKVVYDPVSFAHEAYVLVLGYYCTSYYALIDGNTVHYVLLQLMDAKDIDIDSALLPKGYEGLGDVKNISYNAYEQDVLV